MTSRSKTSCARSIKVRAIGRKPPRSIVATVARRWAVDSPCGPSSSNNSLRTWGHQTACPALPIGSHRRQTVDLAQCRRGCASSLCLRGPRVYSFLLIHPYDGSNSVSGRTNEGLDSSVIEEDERQVKCGFPTSAVDLARDPIQGFSRQAAIGGERPHDQSTVHRLATDGYGYAWRHAPIR